MPLAQEKRRRGQVELRFCAGDREKSIEILVARSGEPDYCAIHHLLAGKAYLAEQPPDRRMKPENTTDQLFHQREEPIVTPDVDDFVAENGLLHRQVELGKISRKEHGGAQEAEGNRTRNGVGDSEVGLHTPGGNGAKRPRMAPQARETPEAGGQPDNADQHTGAEQKEGNFGGR